MDRGDLLVFPIVLGKYSVEMGGPANHRDTESETGSGLRAVSTEPDAGLGLTHLEIMT